MSMYSELLAASMADERAADGGSTKSEFRALLIARRRGIFAPGTEDPGRSDVADLLIRQIDYDIVLMRVCTSLGIHIDPAKFGQRQRERMRLERELVRAGIDLDAFDRSDRPR